MIAPLEVVTGMPLIPHACVLCANNPADEVTGEQQEHVFAPGVDVNWGDSVYICSSCCDIISDLRGRVTKVGFDELTRKYERLKEEHEEVIEAAEHNTALIERIKDGKAAVKEAKKSQPSKKKAKVS